MGNAGGVAMLWRKGVTVDLWSLSSNHIDVTMQPPGQDQRWRCTGYYDFADQGARHRSWDLLRHLARQSELP